MGKGWVCTESEGRGRACLESGDRAGGRRVGPTQEVEVKPLQEGVGHVQKVGAGH